MIEFDLEMETEIPEKAIKLLQENISGYIIKNKNIYRVYIAEQKERSLIGNILKRIGINRRIL